VFIWSDPIESLSRAITVADNLQMLGWKSEIVWNTERICREYQAWKAAVEHASDSRHA